MTKFAYTIGQWSIANWIRWTEQAWTLKTDQSQYTAQVTAI